MFFTPKFKAEKLSSRFLFIQAILLIHQDSPLVILPYFTIK